MRSLHNLYPKALCNWSTLYEPDWVKETKYIPLTCDLQWTERWKDKWIAWLVSTGHLQSRVLIIKSGYELANSLLWTKIHSVSFQCKLLFIVLPAFSIFEIKTPICIMNNNLFLNITSLFLTVQKDVMYKIWTHLVSTVYLLSSCF